MLIDFIFFSKQLLKKNYFKFRSVTAKLYKPLVSLSDISIISCQKALLIPETNTPKRIFGHSFDYDIYLDKLPQTNFINASYAVFIDQNLYFNHDQYLTGNRRMVNSNYFEKMEAFFCKLEIMLGIFIVIAPHPKGLYNIDHPFFNRLSKDYTTDELIKNSILVLSHYSTAISFAILFNKPIVLLTSNDLNQNSHIRHYISSFKKELNCNIFNIDYANKITHYISEIFKIDQKAYKRYEINYIKYPQTPNLPLWEIFANEILEMLYLRNKN